MEIVNEFQYRLLKVIAERQILAADLAKATGIDKGAISNYINGVYEPKYDKICKLADALGVDARWLATGEEPTTNITLTKTEERIVKAYRTANEGVQFAVRKLLEVELR